MLHSITDVHAHYDEAVFDTDRGEVLRTLREAACAPLSIRARACRPPRAHWTWRNGSREYMPV